MTLLSIKHIKGKRAIKIPDDITSYEAANLALFLAWSGKLDVTEDTNLVLVEQVIAELNLDRIFEPLKPYAR